MTDPYSDEEIGGLGSGPRYPLRSTADGTFVTHIDYRDVYAAVPGCDDGIGAWMPLTHDQRHGNACIDCHSYYGGFPRRYVGVCDDGPVNVCQSCYEQRLFDHIDHYRPQS